jgi:hypothetical protein
MEFAVNHANALRRVFEGLLALRIAGIFGPMVSSARQASNLMSKLGIASLNLTGNLLGIRNAASVFVPLVKDTGAYAGALTSLAAEEGIAGAASIAMSDALKAAQVAMSSIAVPIAVITGGIWATTKALETEKSVAEASAGTAVTWADMWRGAIDNVKEDVHDLGDVIKAVMTGDWSYLADVKFTRLGDAAAAEAKKRQAAMQQQSTTMKPKQTSTGPQKDMGGITLTRNNTGQQLATKLGELRDKALKAREALALVGADSHLKESAEVEEKYAEWLTQNSKLLSNLKGAALAAAQAVAHGDIVLEVTNTHAAQYAQGLDDLHQQLAMSTQDHLAMAAAVGKSAAAMQNAMVSAQVNQKMQGLYGNGWQNNAQAVADSKKLGASYRDDLNKNNSLEDKRTADNLNLQLAAQQKLNAVILQGAEAKRQAQIANEQAAVRAEFTNRGDTDSNALQRQLDAVRKKSDVEAEAADLERANSMNAASRYQEQAQSILDAVAVAKKYGIALDYRDVLAADREAWLQFQEAQDKAILDTGNGLDGVRVALDEMATQAQTTAQIMHDAFSHAVDSINQSLSSSLMAHANNSWEYKRNIVQGLSNTSRGIGSSLLNQGFKKVESTALGKMGFGKADGSSGNPFYVRLAGDAAKGITGLAGSMGSLKGLGGFFGSGGKGAPAVDVAGWAKSLGMTTSTPGASQGGFFSKINGAVSGVGSAVGNAAGGWFGRLLKNLPHFANGGTTMPGMPSIIGENGPELWVPPSAGRVVPNRALSGGTGHTLHIEHIDARGSHDPAQTAAMIHQALRQAAPQIAAGAVKAMHDQTRRSPVASRR